MDKRAAFIKAAETLRSQQLELHELREKIAHYEAALRIVDQLIEHDSLPLETVVEKIGELRAKPLDELQLMEKAAELYGSNAAFTGFGKLSDMSAPTGDNALINYLLSEGE
jgi:ParB-like chromosome segregation protein Spo0J